ncbi:hypothetical protein F52700_6849 [Fusarium sp. NRRL 52700]|nr:hypothetical protein F52700_6849 [Fusarium sp. NRRL 52700]
MGKHRQAFCGLRLLQKLVTLGAGQVSRHFALFCEVQLGFKVNTVNSIGEIIDGADGVQENPFFFDKKIRLNIPADEALGRFHFWDRRELDIERVPIIRDGKAILYLERYMNPEQNACLPLPVRIEQHAERSAESFAD